MDKTSVELYKRALAEGYEKDYNVRVMVVGQYEVGKTCLTKRLLNQIVDVSERKPTEGIDVYVRSCNVQLDTQEWTIDIDKTGKTKAP